MRVFFLISRGLNSFVSVYLQNLVAVEPAAQYYCCQCSASNDEPMAACMKAFMAGYSQTERAGVFSPKGLLGAVCKKNPRFKGFAQQDSEELLHTLLDSLQARREGSMGDP